MAAAAVAPGALAAAAAQAPSLLPHPPTALSLFDLQDPMLDAIFAQLGLADLAAAGCTSWDFRQLSARALRSKTVLSAAADLPMLPRAHNLLLMGGGSGGGDSGGSGDNSGGGSSSGGGMGSAALAQGGAVAAPEGSTANDPTESAAAERQHASLASLNRPSQRAAVLSYLPKALHHASRHCRSLQCLHLELPPPQVPLAAAAEAVARAAAGETWGAPAPAEGAECPPVDGFLLKLLAQCCPGLLSVRLINVTNNATMNRLVRLNDACLAILARSCPQLEELVIGHRGGQDCMYNPQAPFYLEDVTDAGLRALAHHCPGLGRLGLLRCSRVSDDGLMAVARTCRQLTSLLLHECPSISDRGLVEVGERCSQLRALDCTVARRAGGLLLMGEEPDQLGFRALFTIAANCPLLEDLCISEESLESPVVDNDCLVCVAQGCPRLRRLVLRHCGGVNDAGVCSVALRCKQLQEIVLEHTAVGDAGLLHLAQLPRLRSLTLSNFISSLGHLSFLPGGPHVRGVSDAALQHVAEHCRRLEHLAITGSRRVTDAGVMRLAGLAVTTQVQGLAAQGPAAPLPPAFYQQLTSLAINHTAATDGSVCALLRQCGQLRQLELRGLLYNADAAVACVADTCRHLTSLDLRHCSTLSDGGLAEVSRLPFLRRLHLSFCVRLTDAGLLALAGPTAASSITTGPHKGDSSGTGDCSTSASSTVASALGGSYGTQHWGITVRRTSSGGGWEHGSVPTSLARSVSMGAQASAMQSGAELTPPHKLGSAAAGCRRLQELELYHCPQVTHRGLWALAEACLELQHVNIGKCRLVKADGLRALLARRPALRLSACHYLDS